MAPPANGFVQGLLQSLGPWMTGANPSGLDNSFQQYGGTQGLLDAMLQANTPGNLGRAMEASKTNALANAASRQGLAQQGMGLQFASSLMPLRLAMMRQRMARMGATPTAPGTPGGMQGSSALGVPPGSGVAPSDAPPLLRATPQQLSASGQPQQYLPPPQTVGSATPSSPNAYSDAMDDLGDAQFEGFLGMPGAATDLDVAKTRLQYSPAIATQMALAKNPLTQDRALIAQAQDSGSPLALKAAQMKYLKDAGMVNVAAYNGAVTTLGGLTPAQVGASTLNPVQGIQTTNGVETAIPGAPQTQQALAAAKGLGGAAGRTVNVGGIPVPALDVLGRGGAALPPSPSKPAINSNQAPSSSAPSSFADLLREGEYQKQLGEEGGKQVMGYQEAADAARNANYALDQMIQDGQKVSLGPAAGAKEWGLKVAAGLGQMVGMAPPQELSNYQELDKYANQVAFAATRQMGSREAAQIVHLQMQSNPNKELTAPAFMDLAGSMKAMNNYIMAKNVAIQQASQENGGNTALASAKWTQQIDPRVWDLTLSPQMGDKWAAAVGKDKIAAAWPYLTPPEQQALIANIPAAVRAQWLK